jgi:hypothetical protein
LQKKSTGIEPHYLDVWLPVHDDDGASAEKLVSNNIKCYAIFVIYPYVLTNILQEQYTQELRKIHGDDVEDPRSMPFNPDVVYVVGGGTL